eukprot:4422279-Amphidinium_carterae.1
MALFPSEADATGFVALLEISTWVGLSDPAFNAFQRVEPCRVTSPGHDSHPLTVVECSQVGLVWRIARRISLWSLPMVTSMWRTL